MLRNVAKYTGQNNFRQSIVEPLLGLYCRLITEKYGDEVTDDLREVLLFYIGGQITYAESHLVSGNIPSIDETYKVFSSCIPAMLAKYC